MVLDTRIGWRFVSSAEPPWAVSHAALTLGVPLALDVGPVVRMTSASARRSILLGRPCVRW
jgi:hypothetical protein